jgi:hypothetical protein
VTKYTSYRVKFVTFAICNREVVSQIEWTRQYNKDRGRTSYQVDTARYDLRCIVSGEVVTRREAGRFGSQWLR